MNIMTGLTMFPLQAVQVTDFWRDKGGDDAKFFAVGIGIVIVILIIINVLRTKLKLSVLNDSSQTASRSPRRFPVFSFHKIVRNLGLTREQAKMLDFVFRSDGATDPIRSLNTAALLDRHFKRAYRIIEHTSISEDEMTEKLSVLFAIRNIIENNVVGATATSTRQIPDNTAAVLTVNDLNYPVRVISSKGDSLVVQNPTTNTGEPLRLPRGSKAGISFFTKTNKGFSVESRVLGIAETAEGQVLQLVHSGQIKKLSNRRFRRRQTVISTSFFFVTVENLGRKKTRLIVDKRRFSGNILDISIGGCSIKTNTSVSSGQKLKIEFTREDHSIVAALGEVLRTNKSGMSTIMHVKFIKIPRKSLNTINAVVYEYARD